MRVRLMPVAAVCITNLSDRFMEIITPQGNFVKAEFYY